MWNFIKPGHVRPPGQTTLNSFRYSILSNCSMDSLLHQTQPSQSSLSRWGIHNKKRFFFPWSGHVFLTSYAERRVCDQRAGKSGNGSVKIAKANQTFKTWYLCNVFITPFEIALTKRRVHHIDRNVPCGALASISERIFGICNNFKECVVVFRSRIRGSCFEVL